MENKASEPIIKNYKKAVDFAVNMIEKTEVEIKKVINKDEAMSRHFPHFTSIPRIGNVIGWMTIT